MAFNLKKNAQKVKDSVLPISTGLQNNENKYSLSLQDKDFVPNFNSILEKDRRPLEGTVVTHEAMLDEKRKKAAAQEKITEGALEDANSPLYPHRQFKDGEENYQVSPINALSQVNDSKYRDSFSKANKDGDTAFWDEFVGAQLDGPITKVPTNITDKGSQLQNNPERFGKNKNLPSDPSAIVNRDNFGVGVNVTPMLGAAKGKKGLKMALSSLKDADGLLFGIYLKAAKENRTLSFDEQELVDGINRDKTNILLSLAQSIPPSNPNAPVPPVPPTDNPRNADFLDGSPDDQQDLGDESYWASQSGFSSGRPGIIDAAETNPNAGDISFGDPSEPSSQVDAPIGQDYSFDNGQLPGVQDSNDPNGVVNTGSELPLNEVDGGIALPPKANQDVEETPF